MTARRRSGSTAMSPTSSQRSSRLSAEGSTGVREGPPEAVVFDNDGLLLDTEGLWTKAQVKLFAAHGRPFEIEHKRAFVGVAGPLAEARLGRMLDAPGRGP